tara:strand:- start:1964 stop:3256 length:1293 start_codon:yes stop_codon:yes gene_type:complete
MSGSIAAVAAYNGSGTQGYGTTDEYVPGVKSVFWNEKDTDKYYVNGSAVSEVPANTNTIKSAETIVFTLDNDSDAVSDLKLLVSTDSSFNPGEAAPRWILAGLIDRVEICVGNQVISTISTTGLIKNFLDSSEIVMFCKRRPMANSRFVNTYAGPSVFSTVFNLDIFGNSNNNLNESYLMACANNQTLQVKVYPAAHSFVKDDFNNYIANGTITAISTEYTFRLFCNKSTMTNAERDFLRKQVIPKRTNITQFSSRLNVASLSLLQSAKSVTINCDNFNIYADALYVLAPQKTQIRNYGLEIEVYLNSTSYSGIIPPEIVNIRSKAGAALYNDTLTVSFSGSPLQTEYGENFLYYKISLANLGITDQDYVPLSRYDSIRVLISPVDENGNNVAFNESQTIDPAFYNFLGVVATGKCTGLYQNGAVTFNNY